MFKSKRLLALGMSIAVMTAFSACGTKTAADKAAPETKQQVSTAATEEKKEATKEEVKNDVKLQLVGLMWSDESFAKNKADATNSNHILIKTRMGVEQKYPDYQISWEDWGWAEQLDQKQRITIMSGNSPDTVHGEFFMPAYAQMDLLEPLPADIADKVNPNMLLKNKKDEPVAVAASGSIFMLYYNKDVLKQAGIDPEAPIKSWDDFKKVSDQITAKGGGKIFGGGVPTHPHAGGALRAAPFIRMLGADFGGGSKATINTPEMIKALTYIREMNRNFPKGIGNNPDEGPLGKMFETDKTLGFCINGTWELSNWAGKKNDMAALGYTALPVSEVGKDANCLVGFDYYGVPKLSKNKEQAFNILRVMIEKDNSVAHMKVIKAAAPNKEAYDDASVREDKAMASFLDIMKSGSYKGLPVFDKNESQVWDVINSKVLARTTMTNDPIEKIVAEAQEACDKILK